MITVRYYAGARAAAGVPRRLREIVRALRPQPVEPFLRLSSFPAEQAQVDWADFGAVKIGRDLIGGGGLDGRGRRWVKDEGAVRPRALRRTSIY